MLKKYPTGMLKLKTTMNEMKNGPTTKAVGGRSVVEDQPFHASVLSFL